MKFSFFDSPPSPIYHFFQSSGTARFALRFLPLVFLCLVAFGGDVVPIALAQTADSAQPSSATVAQEEAPLLPEFRASYIWYPEEMEKSVKQPRYFRKTFELDEIPNVFPLHLYLDDTGTVFLNGTRLPFNRSGDAAQFLKKGRNVLALSVTNLAGPGCVLCYGETPEGVEDVFSDLSWKCSREAVGDWTQAEFDDSAWATPQIVADLHSGLWREFLERFDFMSASEKRQYQALKDFEARKREAIVESLKREPIPRVSYEYRNGSPWILIGEKAFPAQIFNAGNYLDVSIPKQRERIRNLGAQKLHLLTIHFHLATLWKDESSPIDATDSINQLTEILKADPEAHFLIQFRLEPPRWFMEKYPKECIGYATQSASYSVDALRNLNRPSFASEIFKKQAGAKMVEFIQQLEASHIGRRVFAYQPNYGVYTEWHYFGMDRDMPDCGSAMTRRFRLQLREKYGSDEALQHSWADPSVTLDTATVPGVKERLTRPTLGLRSPTEPADRRVLDYLECQQKVWFECLEHFDRLAKQACGSRALVGNYVGYFFGMPFPAEGWHSELERILSDSFSDYLVAPAVYRSDFRRLGGPGAMRTLSESYRLHGKLNILEADTRTHLTDVPNHRYSTTQKDTLALLARDLCAALVSGSAFWRFDFNLGWYDEPEMFDLIGKGIRIAELQADATSVGEVAVVGDFDSVPYHTYSDGYSKLSEALTNTLLRELSYCGAPFDLLSLGDLALPNVRDYKAYVFLNPIFLNAEKRRLIADLKSRGKTILWLYAPGFVDENGAGTEKLRETTGFQTEMLKTRLPLKAQILPGRSLTSGLAGQSLPRDAKDAATEGPVFFLNDPEAEILAEMDVNDRKLPVVGVKKNGSTTEIYSTVPVVSREFLRNLFQSAGVHLYSDDADDVLLVNRSFVALHTARGGEKTIRLPAPARIVKRLLPDEEVASENSAEIKFHAEPNSTTLFLVEYATDAIESDNRNR